MTKAEARIDVLENGVIKDPGVEPPVAAIVFALCEIARQLARIGDLYEFELGLEDTAGESNQPDEQTFEVNPKCQTPQ